MAARKTRKPAPRKPATRSAEASGKGLAIAGWAVAALVGTGWAVNDGRIAAYLSSTASVFAEKITNKKDVGARPGSNPVHSTQVTASVVKQRSAPPQRLAMPAVSLERTAAIHPSPKPQILMPRDRQRSVTPASTAQASLPDASPYPPASLAPTGVQRHATRLLAAHAGPDASSPKLADVASGSPVEVLRVAGEWRYVRSTRTNAEGWVDGRFLAGEASGEPALSASNAAGTLETFRFDPTRSIR